MATRSPYYYLGNQAPTTVKKKPAAVAPAPNYGWGSATHANDMSSFGYDVPSQAPGGPPVVSGAVPSGGGGGFQEPDWAALIAGDPEYQSAMSGFGKANANDHGALQEAIRRAVVGGGYDLGTDEWIDETTRQAALGNQTSTRAGIADELRRGSAQSDASLAARGILSSGQFTENRGQLQRGADTANASARDQLLNVILGGQRGYANAVSERDAQLQQLRASVAGRLAQNPGIFGPAAAAAPAAPGTPQGAPAAAAPWGGISWGGRTGIKTRAALIASLAPGVTWASWAANHPDAARRLT